MILDEGLFLAESVDKIEDSYFTYSLTDLGILIKKPTVKGELVRIVGLPYSGIYGINTNCSAIHYSMYKSAKNEGIADERDTERNIIHFYSIYDDNIAEKINEAKKLLEDEDFDPFDTIYTSFLY